MTIPNFPLPHIQPTGTIQNPGDLGALGQSMQGLAPILMALKQQQLERERNTIYEKQVEGMLAQQQAEQSWKEQQAQLQAADNAALGQFASILNTPSFPGVAAQAIPVPGMPTIQMPSVPSQEVDPDQLIGQFGQVAPRLVPEAIKQNEKRIGELRDQRSAKKTAAAFDTFLGRGKTPDAFASAIKQVTPSKRAEFVEMVNKAAQQDGTLTFQIQEANGGYEWVGLNNKTGVSVPTGVKAPEPKGTTVNVSNYLPSDTEKRIAGLLEPLEASANTIFDLRAKGYDPSKERAWARGVRRAPLVPGDLARGISNMGLSEDGRAYFTAMETAIRQLIYVYSGAQATDEETDGAARSLLAGLFSNPADVKRRERLLVAMINGARKMGDRALNTKLNRLRGVDYSRLTWEDLDRAAKSRLNPDEAKADSLANKRFP